MSIIELCVTNIVLIKGQVIDKSSAHAEFFCYNNNIKLVNLRLLIIILKNF